eukprot:385594-Pyramimonas_sp.AAC.1
MVSRSLARAVWRSDVRLARVLLHQHPWTQSLVHIVGEIPMFLDPGKFQDLHGNLQRQECAQRKKALEEAAERELAPGRRSRLVALKQALHRRAQLWNPLARRKFLSGLLVDGAQQGEQLREGGQAVGAEDMLADGLARYWAPVFSKVSEVPPG